MCTTLVGIFYAAPMIHGTPIALTTVWSHAQGSFRATVWLLSAQHIENYIAKTLEPLVFIRAFHTVFLIIFPSQTSIERIDPSHFLHCLTYIPSDLLWYF
ncbi:hypothetical protein HGRIS_001288 [Hohenbuehelia grisea]|uniref:Uncharacterized protein n=1 Tax=Hohenbuehelia grisea TaxID=104357 RepID=A0ABR3JPX4_9AGAR